MKQKWLMLLQYGEVLVIVSDSTLEELNSEWNSE